MRIRQALLWALIGALPGLVLLFLAYFVIEGELELTVGAPGFVLLPLGFVMGFVFGWFRQPTR